MNDKIRQVSGIDMLVNVVFANELEIKKMKEMAMELERRRIQT